MLQNSNSLLSPSRPY